MQTYLLQYSNLLGRLDVFYYLPSYAEVEDSIQSSEWEKVKLSDIFEISRGGSPRPIHKFLTDSEDGINWIKIGDTKGVDKYIYRTAEKIIPEGAKHSRKVEVGDFILSNSMSFGRPYIMKTTGCIHDGWLLLRPKAEKEVSIDYLHTLLSSEFVYKLFEKQTIGGVVQNLNINLVKEVVVPLPPLDIQQEIAAIMQSAYERKQQLEQEAEQLLSSFNDYVQEALGIDVTRQGLRKTFVVEFQQLTGILSANHYAAKALDTSKYRPLGELAIINPSRKSELPPFTEDEPVPYVGLPETDEGMVKQVLHRPYREVKGRNVITTGDILFARIEPSIFNKKYILVDSLEGNDYAFTSTEFYVIEAKEHINAKYLFALLFSPIVYNQVAGKTTGSTGRRRLDRKVFSEIMIPFPDQETQDKIANEYEARTEKARQLTTKATTLVTTAQNKIQSIILGNHDTTT